LPYNIQQLLAQDATQLVTALTLDASSARIEVQSLLQHVLKVSRAYLLAHSERCLDDHELARYGELLHRRLHGEPLAYIVGEREFFGLMFKVTPATLIPRPETELLVELALQRIPPQGVCRILDMGTGSGAIALSIAHAWPDAEIMAVDASAKALDVARTNAQRLDIGNASFLQSDWYEMLDTQHFDFIVANPPYVAIGDPHLQQGDLRFEPPSALISGADGLEAIRHIVAVAPTHLFSRGWLLLEHGYDQAARVRDLLRQAGLTGIFSALDLAGIERVSGGQMA
jgi:release factor glutamine methyltransferase